MSVPALRFKEFSGDWEEKTLQELADVKGGKRIPKGYSLQDESNGLPYITVTDMNRGGVDSNQIRYVPTEIAESIKNYKITTNDIFISVAGTLGIVGIVPKELNNANLTENANKLTNLKCHQHYLLQYLLSDRLVNLIDNVQTVGAQPKLAIYALNSLEVSTPSLPEQTKIANFLTVVDEKISLLTQKADLLSQYKKGVMQQIFSQELRFKDDDGQEFPEWEEKRLGDIATFSKGKGISKADIDENGKAFCIRYGELYTEYGETIDVVKSKTNVNVNNLILSEINDVLIPASGETQIDIATSSCVRISGVVLGGDLNIIKSQENGVFLAYYLNTQKKLDIAKLAQGNSVVHLYASQLKLLDLKLPELKEQTKIANFFTAVDEKITNNQTQLNALKQYKQGLLQQMFV